MAQKHVIGNWKMNLTNEQATNLLLNLNQIQGNVKQDVNLGISVPNLYFNLAKETTKNSIYSVGVQNIHHQKNGAYTGETSVDMAKSVGAQFTLIGHSERREYNAESNQQLKQKVDLAIENDLTPVFCCGESLETRKAGNYIDFIKTQLEESLLHLKANEMAKVIVAYEPIWAIGTGETASPEQAQEVHAAIRSLFSEKYGKETASEIAILYGGSCKPGNAKELFSQLDIDGGLIGGASLKAEDFIAIANSFE